MGDLSDHFDKKDFICKCGCGIIKVDPSFLDLLERVRVRAGIPFFISSGCRCEDHNRAEGGSKRSDHLTGLCEDGEDRECKGSDVGVSSSKDRNTVVSSAVKEGVPRIGVAKGFVHLGSREDRAQDVLWIY